MTLVPPTASALAGRDDGREMLEALDLDRAWYRYRHPFAALYGVLLRIRDLGLTLLSLGSAPAGHGRGARREDAV